MPKLRNIVTGTIKDLPARYIGLYPYEVVEDEKPAVVVPSEGYKADAIDGDGDGFVQDGTPFERAEGTELSPEKQQEVIKKVSAKKSK